MEISISVIVPAYNVENYIEKTLRSLLMQTDRDFEILIINDGSTDSTVLVAEKLIEEDVFARCQVINKSNSGVSAARNLGLQLATGTYVYFLDSDDYVEPNLIEMLKTSIRENAYDMVIWGYNHVSENFEEIQYYFDTYSYKEKCLSGAQVLEKILLEDELGLIWTSSALYKKSLLDSNLIHFDERFVNGEDQEFIFMALSRTKEVLLIPEVLTYYLQRLGSVSNSYNLKRFDVIAAFDAAASYIEKQAIEKGAVMADSLRNRMTIEHYLANWHSCLSYLVHQNNIPLKQAHRELSNDIETQYPGLQEELRSRMEQCKVKDLKKWVKYRLFLISPLLYMKTVERFLVLK